MSNDNKSVTDLIEENKRLKERLECLEEIIEEKTDYADDLVWYARSREARPDLEQKHPEEVAKYRENPDWQHGYNSACLALNRLLLTVINAERDRDMFNKDIQDENAQAEDDDDKISLMTTDDVIEEAIEAYPSLDT